MKKGSRGRDELYLAYIVYNLMLIVLSPSLVCSHNITHILDGHPDFSAFKALLVKYGVANQINSRSTITVLCPTNAAVAAIAPRIGDPESAFAVLSYHVLLDYFDLSKLKSITEGTALVATLYQTTGKAEGNGGFVNVTNVKGVPMLGMAAPGSHLTASITASLGRYPYNISVLSVSKALVPAGVGSAAPSPSADPVDIRRVVARSGNYSIFLGLAQETGVDKVFQSHDVPPGLTIFVPDNVAFEALPDGVLGFLSIAERVALLQFHAVPSFYPSESLMSLAGIPILTLAGDPYTFGVLNKGGKPVIDTGFNAVPVGSPLYSQNPVAIYGINSVLLPSAIFGFAPANPPSLSPSPSPSPSLSPSPSPATSPAASPSLPLSPPAPPPQTINSSSPGPSSIGPSSPGPNSDENKNALAPPALFAPWTTLLALVGLLLV